MRFFGETDFSRELGDDRGAPLWVQGKVLVGTRQQNSWKLQGSKLWNQLLLIKIYPPQPVMKLIQHFSKICASLTRKDPAYFQITYHCILLKIYGTKKLFWAPNLGIQTGLQAPKSLWIHLWLGTSHSELCHHITKRIW